MYPGCAGQSLASHQVLTQTLSEQETPEGLATDEPMSYPRVNALGFQMTQCPLSSPAIIPTDRNEKGNQSCPLSTNVRERGELTLGITQLLGTPNSSIAKVHPE